MPGKKLTVVISQQQGKNPVHRHLEEEIAVALLGDPEVDVSLVPHLYDLTQDHTGMLFLRSIPGDLLVLSWLFPRATRWVLDRNSVKGQVGISLLDDSDDEDSDDEETSAVSEDSGPQGIGSLDVPSRKIYCLDLRCRKQAREFVDEIRRIARENAVPTVDLLSWIQGSPHAAQMQRYLNPPLISGEGMTSAPPETEPAEVVRRRWYPVIDYSRCTNCMECIDFCLFGVYGIDALDRILVEQQDNCKKGCPACSRVCPANAILFPLHKSDAIAGADGGEVSGLKIDLSKLFGAPSALEMAALERDQELVADGRTAVGLSVGVAERHRKPTGPRDELDDLMDGLDQLDL